VIKEVVVKGGKIDIEYGNEVLKAICEMLTEYKDNHAFRYRTLSSILKSGFSKVLIKGQIERRINLLSPIYLIKRAFTIK
jgi:hypothetical protein